MVQMIVFCVVFTYIIIPALWAHCTGPVSTFFGGLTLSEGELLLIRTDGRRRPYLRRESSETNEWYEPNEFEAKRNGFCHLDGAFFKGFGNNEGIWQVIMNDDGNRKGVKRATQRGAEFAGKNKDSANYNLYMWSLNEYRYKLRSPYIYHSTQTANHCASYAINFILQFEYIKKCGMKEFEDDSWVSPQFVPFGLKKQLIAKDGPSRTLPKIEGYEPDVTEATLRKDQIIGWMENLVLERIKPTTGTGKHWVVYKYMLRLNKWIVLDPSFPLLDTNRFNNWQDAKKKVYDSWLEEKGDEVYEVFSSKLYAIRKDNDLFAEKVVVGAHVLDILGNNNYVLNNYYDNDNDIDYQTQNNYVWDNEYESANSQQHYSYIYTNIVLVLSILSIICFCLVISGIICGYVASIYANKKELVENTNDKNESNIFV